MAGGQWLTASKLLDQLTGYMASLYFGRQSHRILCIKRILFSKLTTCEPQLSELTADLQVGETEKRQTMINQVAGVKSLPAVLEIYGLSNLLALPDNYLDDNLKSFPKHCLSN